jgi:HEAT repeat protein
MMRAHLSAAALLLTIAGGAAPAGAQPPRISNGRLTSQAAGSPLAGSFQTLVAAQPDVAWIGYSVPAAPGERTMCCSDGNGSYYRNGSGPACCGTCRLEPSSGAAPNRAAAATAPSGPIALEASDRLVVLFRVAERKVERIRVFSQDCELDAGGRTVTWLDGVRPADSIALLEGFTRADAARPGSTVDGAVTAIALHGDPSADAALERLVAAAQPESLRKKVTFWLGNARGARGLALLQRVLRDDPSAEVRKGAVFGVSQSREPGVFDLLTSMARTDQDARIRAEALFWMAQKGDARAGAVIAQAAEKDPAAEVRKKAVFALSQLPDDSGVAALIGIARNAADASARGEAIFWLGQKAGNRAASAITDRIANDPDTEVKKRAVFALSQMPPAEGVPLLINVAKTNRTPEVRKQAIFWLGQSKDARALAFFEEVLTK